MSETSKAARPPVTVDEKGYRWRGARKLVRCDDQCDAYAEPAGEAELAAAYEHWRHHDNLGGCAHGC